MLSAPLLSIAYRWYRWLIPTLGMKSVPRIGPELVGVLLTGLLVVPGAAQSRPQLLASTEPLQTAIVRVVQVLQGPDGPAVEILSSRPLVPSISKLENPPRLAIDLPNARLASNKRRIDFRSEQVSGVRVDQYQKVPPITRVVVDLIKPSGYTWDAAGNRLVVRLRALEEATAKPPSIPAFLQGVQPAAVPLSPGSSGAVVLAGNRVGTGSAVTAGSDTAILRLGRGGEVRVCPGTTVSVTSSQSGHALMLGMSTGALEAHYNLDASADSILTPDFRILLAGPGEFHYAVSADSRGNTCVRALPGNTASAIVSELLGDGTYQVKPSDQIVFHSGRLNLVDTAVPAGCGCPAPAVPVMRASIERAPVVPESNLPATMRLAQPGDEAKPMPPSAPASTPSSGPPPLQVTVSVVPPETAALPPSRPNEVHVQVEAPFVFRAEDARAKDPPPPAPTREAELLPVLLSVNDRLRPALFQTAVLPPTPARAQHHGFFGKMKSFFAAIFG